MTEKEPVSTEQTNGNGGNRRGDRRAREFANRFEEALLNGDAIAAESVANEAHESNLEVEEIYDLVIGPSMIEVGHMWQEGEASVADEHLATAISQQVMAGLFPKLLRNASKRQQRVMLAAPAGEHHVLGLRMIADTLEGAGYEVIYLGPNVPTEALLNACRKHRPTALGLTAATPARIPALVEAIEGALELESPPAIFVGGQAVEQATDLGVDVPMARTCDEAVEFVEELIDNPVRPHELRRSLDRGFAEWQKKFPGLADERIGDESEPEGLGMADAFSTTAMVAAENAREVARDAFRLKELAYRDGLTGLWNRRAYDDHLQKLSEVDRPEGAVLMIDVDRFKEVNDRFGHDAGDLALIGVGEAILRRIRPADFAARYGGDEFVVLLPGMDLASATEVAERIRETIKKEMQEPPVTVSIGVSALDEDPRASGLAVHQALYGAKRAGRDRVVAT